MDAAAAKEIPLHVLERIVAIPYALDGRLLRVAVGDPWNVQQLDELRLTTRHTLDLGVASREDILDELKRVARASGATAARLAVEEELVAEQEAEAEEGDDLEADDGISDAPLVRLVNSVIFQAAEDGASDIHFEPQEDALVVRFRIDGVLAEVQRIPKRMSAGVTTRLKVLAKLDIAERRKPQDGRISLNAAAAGRMLDVRVATLPTVEGEKVVMRLLDKSKKPPTLEELGFSEHMKNSLLSIVSRPTGALLVTGPTGSGKSTTLFACLNQVNRPEVNIITVEDPVEYRLRGVNQVQINVRAGLTFAAALRSILRSDPDVVMVGEIRDGETAKMAIEAALTGHFVLSTLHTNDAPAAITRLQEMGVEPFLTGAAVTGVLAQRLARRLCTNCAEMYHAVRRRPDQGARLAGRRRRLGRDGLLPQARLPPVRAVRLQGPDRHLPADGDDGGAPDPGRDEGDARGARAGRARGRDADDLGRRPGEGRCGAHDGRRARARPLVSRSGSGFSLDPVLDVKRVPGAMRRSNPRRGQAEAGLSD